MSDDVNSDVDRFIDYFNKQLDEVGALQTEHAELFRGLLYASLLDTLAGSVMPKRRNRDRFIYFLKRFCGWSDGERISLSHLVQLLRKNPDPAFQSLREWALAEFKALPVHNGRLMPISHDPSYGAVKNKWPTQKDHRTPLGGIDLAALQHFSLLYIYRNTLVHEFRRPGYGREFGHERDPFYHGMSTVGDPDHDIETTVELVYPQKFLHHLCKTALDELRSYFLANELNPLDSFAFGTYWIRELNR